MHIISVSGWRAAVLLGVLAPLSLSAAATQRDTNWPGRLASRLTGRSTSRTAPAVPPGVAPVDSAVALPGGVQLALAFRVTNPGASQETVSLALSCTGATGQCGAPASVTVGAGATEPVAVSFALDRAVGTTGQITLTATGSGGSAQGRITVTVGPVAVAVDEANAGAIVGAAVARDRCLRLALGAGAEAECGDLRLGLALPAVVTRGRTRAPLLTYSSQHAHPVVLVSADLRAPDGQPVPSSVSVVLTLDGQQVASRQLAGTTWGQAGDVRRATLAVDALTDSAVAPLATGLYPYTVTADFGGGLIGSASGQTIVVNRSASAFGAGWWIAGYERLHPIRPGASLAPTADSLLWVGGDGSARVYVRAYTSGSTTVFGARSVTRPDTLAWEGAVGEWARRLPNAAAVRFDSAGRHRRTVDRLGQSTWFDHAAGTDRLTAIRVPPATGSLAYAFAYDSVTGRLASVSAPGVGAARVTTFGTSTAGDLTSVLEPDQSAVQLEYGGAAHVVTRRIDRRGYARYFTYGAGGRLTGSHAYTQPANEGQLVAVTLCPAEVAGLAASCGVTPPAPSAVATRLDGPRTDVGDTTRFLPDRLGGVRAVVNALGDSTVVTPGDARFPGLATRVRDVTGFTTEAYHNARGLVDSTRALDPLGDGRNAVTRYEWDARWDAATRVTTPEGVVTELAYDSATGNRLWQQTGGPARRVDFAYHATGTAADAGLLAATLAPAVGGQRARDTLTHDATLGNVRRVAGDAPGRAESRTGRDAIGRAVADSVLVAIPAPGDTGWQVTTRTYDLTGRVLTTRARGPALAGADTLAAVVEQVYDAEGALTRVTRRAEPDPAGIGNVVTEWRHDGLGRTIAEIAPDATPGTLADNPVDSTFHDPAGNVQVVRTRRGHTIQMTYDVLNRLATHTIPGVTNTPTTHSIAEETRELSYDAAGRLLTANNADARVTRQYHPGGALRQEELRVRTVYGTDFTAHHYVTGYAYDLDGRRTGVTYPAQLSPDSGRATVAYAYDSTTGALARVSDVQGNVYHLGYTVRGQLDSLALPGGLVERFAYALDGALAADTVFNRTPTGVALRHADSLLRAVGFAYDPAGRLASTANAAGLRDTLTAAYDGLGHVAHTRYVTNPAGIAGTVTHFEATDTLRHDGLANLLTNVVSSGGRTREWPMTSAPAQRYRYQAGTGRLGRTAAQVDATTRVLQDTLLYDAAGNVTAQENDASGTVGRQAYYGADGVLRSASVWAIVPVDDSTDATRTTQEWYRYDALGRRVLVRAFRDCTNQHLLAAPVGAPLVASNSPCRLDVTRRTVWAGAQELGEIQMPAHGDLGPGANPPQENDTSAVAIVAPDAPDAGFDVNRFFGRVAYTHALGIDRPLAVTRLGYVDAPYDAYGNQRPAARFAPFTLVPLWTTRGAAENGSLADGATTTCLTAADSTQRCVVLQWPDGWYPYNRPSYVAEAWHGTLLEDKRDAAGTLYRRNRYYDPATGRFTQEDPIGLAGGVNLYGYASGDPVNRWDPFGLCTTIVLRIVCIVEERVTQQQDGGARTASGGGGHTMSFYFDFLYWTIANPPGVQLIGMMARAGGGGPDKEFIDDVVRRYNLNPAGRRRLHDEITKRGLDPDDIEELAEALSTQQKYQRNPRSP